MSKLKLNIQGFYGECKVSLLRLLVLQYGLKDFEKTFHKNYRNLFMYERRKYDERIKRQ